MKHLVVIFFWSFSLLDHAQTPEVYVLDAQRLNTIKVRIREKDKTVLLLVDKLKKDADALLPMKPVSVMDKQLVPESGNKHDYMSQAPYFWYDSSKTNGRPYLRRDGVRNPEIYKITDRTYLGQVETASLTLSLAWYLTGDEKYALKAATLIRHWFLDDSTKMNPNLDYGQAIPGINTGRGIGIIESRTLIDIADAVGLLKGAPSWTDNDTKGMKDWYGSFLKWMLTSKNGRDEHASKNNHGTWYYAQVIDFALFSGDKTAAIKLVEESKKRMNSQLTKEGKQPLELERTNALGYSTMNLDGWFTVAKLAKHTDTDLWSYKTPEATGLRAALDWLLPYATGKESFPYQQISKYNRSEFYPLLLEAATAFKDRKYLTAATEIGKGDNNMADLRYGN